jgi:hypothetical protein
MGEIKSVFWQEIVSDQLGFDRRDAWDIEVETALSYLEGCGLTRAELAAKYSDIELVEFHTLGLWPEVL